MSLFRLLLFDWLAKSKAQSFLVVYSAVTAEVIPVVDQPEENKLNPFNLFLFLLLLTGCVSYDLPKHRLCVVKDATFDTWGKLEQEITKTNGRWKTIPADTHYDAFIPVLWVSTDSRDRESCLQEGKIPVIFEINSVETEKCASRNKLPNGCSL